MSNDPAFLFYPGDYLRDTQCLSEPAQVAYDRIMCEHMRNICVTQARHDFFTKRLTDSQKAEIFSVLCRTDEGYYIEWVRSSILKRKAYSDSRRKNRAGKSNEDMLTYDSHMENENENEIVTEKGKGKGSGENQSHKLIPPRKKAAMTKEEYLTSLSAFLDQCTPEYGIEMGAKYPDWNIPAMWMKIAAYWHTDEGYVRKLRVKTKSIDWKRTFENGLQLDFNRVLK